MPESIQIRPAVPNDADGIASIFLESAEHHSRLDPERYSMPPFEAISARYKTGGQQAPDPDGKGMTFVADLSGEIAGFVDARLESSQDPMHREMTFCHISEIAVRVQHRNRGIGALLLRAAEAWGRQQGAEFASLEYNAANERAAAFYHQRMGYRVASITAVKRLER